MFVPAVIETESVSGMVRLASAQFCLCCRRPVLRSRRRRLSQGSVSGSYNSQNFSVKHSFTFLKHPGIRGIVIYPSFKTTCFGPLNSIEYPGLM
jgi:hypothetical protein